MKTISVIRLASSFAAAAALTACGGATPTPATTTPTPDMAMASTGTGGGQQPPPAAMPDMAMTTPPPASALPFIVDTPFVTSGFMGDGAMPGAVTMMPEKASDSQDCNGQRAAGTPAGACHSVVYTPPAANGMGWAGVYWQYPANNWGEKAGFAIPAGATKVTFQAKGLKGGEKVTFLAGGIINAGKPYTDSLKATVQVTLTTSWAPYSIDLTGQSYSQVLGGYGWTMAAADAGASGGFFVDDIEWQ
jgi:hypothetical protein